MAYQYPLNGGRINASVGGNSTSAGVGYQLVSTGTLLLAGGNNITLSQNGSAITISGANAPSGSINFSAGTTSSNINSVAFSNSNGVSFGLNGGTITASHNGITSQSVQTIGGYASGNTTGQSSSSTFDARSVSVSAQGGISAGFSGGMMQISGPSVSSLSATGALSLSTNGNTISIGAPAFSAGISSNSTVSNQLILAAGNNITLSQSTNASGATVSISGAAGGGGGGGIALANSETTYTSGTANLNASGALTIVSTTGQQLNFSVPATSSLVGVNGITISTTGNTISISGPGGGGGGGFTRSYFNPQDGYVQGTGVHGNATLHMQPMQAPNVQFDRIALPIYYSNAAGSTASISLSVSVGFYTRTASSLSLGSSATTSLAWTGSGNVNSSIYNGIRLLTIGNTATLTEGQYYVGIVSRTSLGGNNATLQQIVASQQSSNFSGVFGEASNATNQYTRGLGYYTASVTSLPASVGFSQLNGSAAMALRQPLFYLVSQTF